MPDAPQSTTPLALQIDREILVEGIARGIQRALGEDVRSGVREFLEAYFEVMTKEEIAAYLGCSERTVEQLWQDQKIPKDVALGERMPRGPFSLVRKFAASLRIAAREGKVKLKPMKEAA